MLKRLAKRVAVPWHRCRHPWFASLFVLLLIPSVASASLIFHTPLAKAASSIQTLVKGRVNKVDKTVQYQTLKNGKKIETSTRFSYQVEVLAVLYGDAPPGPLQIGHSSFVPIVYNDEGKPVMMFSPVLDGSGLENSLREGHEYLLSIGSVAGNTSGEVPLYRVELPDKEARLLELIHENRAWKLLREKLPDELPKITAYRFDPKDRRLFVFQGTSRIVYSVQGGPLLQYKGYAGAKVSVNHLDTDGEDRLFLLFNQEQQGVVGYKDFQPVEPQEASRP